MYSQDLRPLSDFTSVPDDLKAVLQSNGDIALRLPDGQEPLFDVIAVIIGSCLEAPPGFSKYVSVPLKWLTQLNHPRAKFPFFRRWIKITAVDEPFFAAAVNASKTLYSFMATRADNVLPAPRFFTGGSECFRPSATMLTLLETLPEATPVDIPPLDNCASFEAAVRSGHGKYVFSSDNEVLFFGDKEVTEG